MKPDPGAIRYILEHWAIDRVPRTYNGKLLRRELMGDGAKKA